MTRGKLLRQRVNDDLYLNEAQIKQKQQRIQKKINFRLVVLLVLFGFLMATIITSLYTVQWVNHERYSNMAITQFNKALNQLPHRGEIVDIDGTLIRSNQDTMSLIYIAPREDNSAIRFEKAQLFQSLFSADITYMTRREKQDAYIYFYPEEAALLITDEEKADPSLNDNDKYQLQLSRITDSLIEKSLTQTQLEQFYLYILMSQEISLDVVLKQNITPKDVNTLLEHQNELKGIQVAIGSTRTSPTETSLNYIAGAISRDRQGIPRERQNSLMAQNYKINDKIGTSGLEAVYEDLLSGQRSKYTVMYDQEGETKIETSNEGYMGSTIQMTLDVEYQQQLEQILQNMMAPLVNQPKHHLFDEMTLVLSDPNTGAIKAAVGMRYNHETKEFTADPTITYLHAYTVGSAIKGAIVYDALKENVFRPGQLVDDTPLYIRGTGPKRSSVTYGQVDDIKALSHSSNTYMFRYVIGFSKANYQPQQTLNIPQSSFYHIRSVLSEFGLGVNTGLDVPSESTGYKAKNPIVGNILDYAIGQLDTYSPMQLNQYISTIANGGTRYKLRFVDKAFDPQTNSITYQNTPEILNQLDTSWALERVKMGMRACVVDGYCTGVEIPDFPVAAKTGTAETFYFEDGKATNTITNTMVAYAPYDNPTVAVSCIANNFLDYDLYPMLDSNPCILASRQALELEYQRQQQLNPDNQ